MSNQQQRPPATRGAAARTATSTTNLPAQANGGTIDAAAAPKSQTKQAIDGFVSALQRNFQEASELGIQWTRLQQRLGSNLGIKMHMALEAAEIKRAKNPKKKDDPPFDWDHVNRELLMARAKTAIDLELDAALPNHINIMFYLNGRTGLYDPDIRPGYEGLAYAKPKFAIDPPKSIRYVLIFEGDEFDIVENENGGQMPIYKPRTHFRPAEEVGIGGFGWIRFDDSSKDLVIVVDEYEFQKAENAAPSPEFWGGMIQGRQWNNSLNNGRGAYENVGEPHWENKFRRDMQKKTIKYRVLKHVPLDPSKVNTDAFIALEAAELDTAALEVTNDIDEHANTKELPERFADPETGEVREQQGEPAPAGSTKPLF